MADGRGLPLLSGPPPPIDVTENACRKCSKDFNIIFTRSRKCNHCGYSYCHNCSDFQALMPRTGPEGSGYAAANVCAYCIEYLTITAGGRGHLKTLPLAKLKKYVNAYSIKIDRAVEKDDLIDAILAARGPHGCLSRENENFYRRNSVPDRSGGGRSRGIFGRAGQGQNMPPASTSMPQQQPTYNFPRPDLEPDHPFVPPVQPHNATHSPQHDASPHYHTQPPRSPNAYPQTRTPPYNPYHGAPATPPNASRRSFSPQGQTPYRNPTASRSSHNIPNTRVNSPPRPRATSTVPPPASPPPTLEELLSMSDESIASLSVGALKAILFTNHVNAGMILEKGDLVKKVASLVADERRERERQRLLEEQEEAERIERQRVMLEEHKRAQEDREAREKAERDRVNGINQDEASSSSTGPPPLPPKAQAMAAHLERTGLCVICQDEEANIAIVDCGHLAMCRGCSDLVMKSSRECPLCRTRIVTEARLLRIFKT